MIDVSPTVQFLPPSGIREFFDLVLTMEEVISLGVGEPDFSTPWHISHYAIEKIQNGCTTYTSNSGLLELRKSVSNYLAQEYQISYHPEKEILITVGVSEALDLALRTIMSPGTEVIVVEPCYVAYAPLVTLAGGIPIKIITEKKDGFKLTPETIEAACTPKTRAIIFNYPCNPTGTTYSKQELEKLSKVFEEKDLLVISDEVYHQLSFDYEHIPLSCFEKMKERTILLNGFSKGFAMTGWRVGFACGPSLFIQAMTKIHQYSIMCVPTMGQFAAIEALKNGSFSVEEMKNEYRRRRNYVVNRLNEIGLSCHIPGGAFYVYPEVPESFDSGTSFAKQLLLEEKVAVVPGKAFCSTDKNIRISYAYSMKNLQKALDRMAQFVQRHTGK